MSSSNTNKIDSTNAIVPYSIEDFGLVREEMDRTTCNTIQMDLCIAGEQLKTDHWPEWRTFKITGSLEGDPEPKDLNEYGVSVLHDAYLSLHIQLNDFETGDRLTDMPYRAMIVDNYNTACLSDPTYTPTSTAPPISTLRFLGWSNIVTEIPRKTFENLYFYTEGHDIRRPGVLELLPDRDLTNSLEEPNIYCCLLNRDPLVRGVYALLRDYAEEMNHPFVRSLCFITEGCSDFNYPGMPPATDLALHLVVELGRVGDGF